MIAIEQFWILAICLIGAIQCLFLSSCFAFLRRGNVLGHRMLATLMLFIGLRLSKSAYYLFEGESMSLWLINIGFAAHLAAGPLLWLYLRTNLQKSPIHWRQIFHFLPAIAVVFGSPFLHLDAFWYRGGYYWLLLYALFYWSLSLQLLIKNWRGDMAMTIGKKRWLVSLMTGTGVFFLAYFANYILRIIPYSLAPVVYSIAIFPVSIAAWRNYDIFIQKPKQELSKKYRNQILSNKDITSYNKIIINYLENRQPYLQPEFSLKDLSENTGIPAHVLSNVMNQYLQTNFTTLINNYRIKAACEMLCDSETQHLTIAAIAYESGFNSLSVFNQTFKKTKGMTPSAFRKTHSK